MPFGSEVCLGSLRYGTFGQLETIFVNEINNVNAATNGYYVEKYKQIHELEKNIKIAVEDLQNEGKKIAFIKKGRKIIAVVGYKVT